MHARYRLHTYVSQVFHYLVIVLFTIFAAFPFYWMFITTFKQTGDLYNLKNNPFTFHQWPTLEHLELLFQKTLYARWLANTFLVGVVVVGITLVVAVPAFLISLMGSHGVLAVDGNTLFILPGRAR
jgi:multiple sugar transport system permease protein